MQKAQAADTAAGAPEPRRFDLRLAVRRKLWFRFHTLWNRQGAEKQPAFEYLARRVGGKAVVEARVSGPVYWRADSGPSGIRVIMWPAPPLGPEIEFQWIRWPVECEGLRRSIESIAPKDAGSPEIQERLRDLERSILAASAKAMADTCGINLARAWREASEANPLVVFTIASANRVLPALRRLARGVRRVGFEGALLEALDSETEIEVYLPPLTRAGSKNWTARLKGQGAVPGCGYVRVEKDNALELQPAQVMMAALWAAKRDLPVHRLLSYEHTQRMTAAQARFTLPFLLRRYELEGWGREWLQGREGQVEARVQTWVPGNAAAAWARMPAEKQAAFYEVFIRACKSIHEVLRQWAPYIYFRESSRFDDFETAQAALAFSQSRTIRDRDARSLFTYDLLDPRHMIRALSRMAEPLTRLFADVRRRLVEDGRQETAQKYSWRATAETVRQMRDLVNRPFGLMLQTESQVTHAFMALAVRGSKLGKKRRDAFDCAEELAAVLDIRLRRMFVQESMSMLAPLLIAEVTRTLSAAQGYPVSMNVVVRLSGASGPETIAEAEISGAEWPLDTEMVPEEDSDPAVLPEAAEPSICCPAL